MIKLLVAVVIVVGFLELARPAAAQCGPGEFQCYSGDCIPESYVCDQWPDCPGDEQEDEEGCPIGPCPWPSFQCDNGVCITGYFRCDGYNHCKNGEDEICGPRCYECFNWDTRKEWHTIKKHWPYFCNYEGKYEKEPCELTDSCVTRLKQRRNGKVKVTLACMKAKRCSKLMKKNSPGCYETPIQVDGENGCTFCCKDDYCNYYPDKKSVTAVQ
ncbi:very low-density lipoprotein receptor-like [Ptychodera flava]|uniref:very low-density lipoprotein receptor-like n=1 Tax=Ptychodera flava TaxID=63121 RepID=UPI00396A5118